MNDFDEFVNSDTPIKFHTHYGFRICGGKHKGLDRIRSCSDSQERDLKVTEVPEDLVIYYEAQHVEALKSHAKWWNLQ